MSTTKRQVGFSYLNLSYRKDVTNSDVYRELERILNFIVVLEKADRKKQLNEKKFCFLESYEANPARDLLKITVKAAHHSFRPPLVDSNTIEERDNPKTMSEGEAIKTHFVLKMVNGDAILLNEKHGGGINSLQMVSYLNFFITHFNREHNTELGYSFSCETIAVDDIDEALSSMNRVMSAFVYVDKRVLGSHALSFSDRIDTVKKDIVIEIKANKLQSIKDAATDILGIFTGEKSVVNKVRIKGRNESNNEITIDTDFIEKKEFVNVYLNDDTGEVNSTNIFMEMVHIANTL